MFSLIAATVVVDAMIVVADGVSQIIKVGRVVKAAISRFLSEQNVDSKSHQIVEMKNQIASSIQLHVNGTFPSIIQFRSCESVRLDISATDGHKT